MLGSKKYEILRTKLNVWIVCTPHYAGLPCMFWYGVRDLARISVAQNLLNPCQ